MSYTYKFMDNAYYGIEDLNNLVKNFTTGGVNVYSSTSGQLNDMTAALVGSGTQLWSDACKATVYNSQIKLNPGVAFFDDGSSLTIEAGGEILPNGRYIYMKKDGENSRPVSSSTPPSSNDIPIAEYANGTLTDKRKYAFSKVASLGTGVYYQTELKGTYSVNPAYRNSSGTKILGRTKLPSLLMGTNVTKLSCVSIFHTGPAPIFTAGRGLLMDAGQPSLNDYRFLYIDRNGNKVDHYTSAGMADFIINQTGDAHYFLSFERNTDRIDVYVKSESFDAEQTLAINAALTFS